MEFPYLGILSLRHSAPHPASSLGYSLIPAKCLAPLIIYALTFSPWEYVCDRTDCVKAFLGKEGVFLPRKLLLNYQNSEIEISHNLHTNQDNLCYNGNTCQTGDI